MLQLLLLHATSITDVYVLQTLLNKGYAYKFRPPRNGGSFFIRLNNDTVIPFIMNGRLDKVAMTAYIMKMKTGLSEGHWYPEWDEKQRDAAQRILTNVLERLDEYWQ